VNGTELEWTQAAPRYKLCRLIINSHAKLCGTLLTLHHNIPFTLTEEFE